MKQLSLQSQLIVIAACGVAVVIAEFFAPEADILYIFRFFLLLALLFILSAKISLRRRGVYSENAVVDGQLAEAEKCPRLLKLLGHPLVIGVFLGVVLAVQAYAFRVMSCDEGMWNYIAHIWVKFDLKPYVDAVENKTPGIFYLFTIGNLLFGVNYWFPRVAGIVVTVLTGVGIYAIGTRLQGRLVGLLAMLLFALTSVSRVMDAPLTSQTETFMLGCSVLAAYCLVLLREAKSLRIHLVIMLLAGVCLGAAITFKQIAFLTALGLLFFYLSLAKPYAQTKTAIIRDCLVALMGLLLAMGISLIPLLMNGVTFADYAKGAWLILLVPGSSAGSPLIRVQMAIHVLESLELELYLPLLLLLVLMWRRIRAAGVPLLGLLGWYLCDLLAVNASGMYYGHQLRQALPPLVLLGAMALGVLMRANLARETLSWVHRAYVVSAIALIWWSLPGMYHTNIRANAIMATAHWLKAHTAAQDYVYTFGTLDINPILACSGRRASSRYFNQVFFNQPGTEATIRHDLAEHPPVYIVTQLDRLVGLQGKKKVPAWAMALLAHSYFLEKRFTFTYKTWLGDKAVDGYLIYRRDGSSPPGNKARPADQMAESGAVPAHNRAMSRRK